MDPSKIINAANLNYPRNKIPLPSAGVGGYCLTKDPLIYASEVEKKIGKTSLNKIGRQLNQESTYLPIKFIKIYCEKFKLNFCNTKILILGVAFKGSPSTSDIRLSPALDLKYALNKDFVNVFGADAVVDKKKLREAGFKVDTKIISFDIIVIMNNHKSNITIVNEMLRTKEKNSKFLIVDCWSQIEDPQYSGFKYCSYASLGHIRLG